MRYVFCQSQLKQGHWSWRCGWWSAYVKAFEKLRTTFSLCEKYSINLMLLHLNSCRLTTRALLINVFIMIGIQCINISQIRAFSPPRKQAHPSIIRCDIEQGESITLSDRGRTIQTNITCHHGRCASSPTRPSRTCAQRTSNDRMNWVWREKEVATPNNLRMPCRVLRRLKQARGVVSDLT